MRRRLFLLAAVALTVLSAAVYAAQQMPLPPDVTAEDGATYQASSRYSRNHQRCVPDDVVRALCRCAQNRRRVGGARGSTIAPFNASGSVEAERWNRILTSSNPTFNTSPNAFLAEMIKG